MVNFPGAYAHSSTIHIYFVKTKKKFMIDELNKIDYIEIKLHNYSLEELLIWKNL